MERRSVAVRLLKRLLRIGLYCLLAVVVLSIGLRTYSAWQIPKAKRLLAAMSQIKPGSPEDANVHSLLTTYNFGKREDCSPVDCYYHTQIAGASAGISVNLDNTWAYWLFQHVLVNLGFRPWMVLANIRTSNGHVTGTRFVLLVADQTPIGVGGSISTSNLKASARSTDADFFIDESHKYGSSVLHIQFSPSAPRTLVDSSFKPNFSCVWGLRGCRSGWDVFPEMFEWGDRNQQN